MKCRMCELIDNPDKKVHYKDDKILILSGLKKDNYDKKLLCILKKHIKKPSSKDLSYMVEKCMNLRKKLKGKWDVVIGMYSQPQHFHIHLGNIK